MIIVNNCKESGHGCQVVVWGLSFQKFYDRTTQTPNVRGRCCSRELNNLRGHPVRSSHHLCFLISPSQRTCGDSKVCKFDLPILCGEDVGSLYVSVDNTLIVEVLKPVENLAHVDANEILREFAICLAYRM